jgi:hypothetical protein
MLSFRLQSMINMSSSILSMTSFRTRTSYENSSTNFHDELLNTNTVRKLVLTRPKILMTSYRALTLFENSSKTFNDELSNTNTVRKLVQKFQWRVIEHKHCSKIRPQTLFENSSTNFHDELSNTHTVRKLGPQISMTSYRTRTPFENWSTNFNDELSNKNTVIEIFGRVFVPCMCSKTRHWNFNDKYLYKCSCSKTRHWNFWTSLVDLIRPSISLIQVTVVVPYGND